MSASREPGVCERPVTRVGPSPAGSGVDVLAVEEPLEIRIASESIAITMRTPGDDLALAVGFLFSEGIIRAREDVGAVAHCGRPGDTGFGNVVEVTPAPGVVLDVERVKASRRGTLTTSACGVCGRRSVDDLLSLCGEVPESIPLPSAVVAGSTAALRGVQRNFAQTGGVHAATALNRSGAVLASAEDVGRHNAVDKVVGALVLQSRVSRASARLTLSLDAVPALLVVSGRASFEIVQKAAMAGIPVVASVSAGSSLAVDLAERAGVALATFVRDRGFNLYTHPWRISGLPTGTLPAPPAPESDFG